MGNETDGTPYMMRKSDFVVCGFNEYIMTKGTHIPLTFAQMKFVQAAPLVNGPKLCLFYMSSVGMPKEVTDKAFADMLFREQAAQDKGAAAYVPEAEAAEAVKEEAPAAAAPAPVSDTDKSADMRASLMLFEDKAMVAKYAESTLGLTVKLDPRWGKERMVETILAELAKKQAVPTADAPATA